MTAHPAGELVPLTVRRGRASQPRPVSVDPIIGKDILELVSSAMYVDARTVYREYIQNAADAIDDAFASGLLDEARVGRVDVKLDVGARTARIRDNGAGLRKADAERVLTSFGASPKREKDARGFRGVGRLAALGYAQAVSFKTKAAGESHATEVTWDCRRLKSALLDPTYSGDVKQLVRDVVTVRSHLEDDNAAHYFEVLLEKVIRIRNDVLLNPHEIEQYLSEIAPAPFREDFPFVDRILDHLHVHVPPCRFEIYLNDSGTPLTRPHSGEFALTKTKVDVPTNCEILELPDGEGGLRAIGWLVHHNYLGAIHAAQNVRGIRARVGNIQIGDGDIFADVFPEARFNSWTIGEVHVLDRRIVPNARRDDFEQSAAYSDLLAQLGPIARDVARRCRQSSARRNRLRAIELREKRVVESLNILSQPTITREREQRTRREIGAEIGEIRKLTASAVLADTDQKHVNRRVAALEKRLRGMKGESSFRDPLEALPKARQAAYRSILDLIYECSGNQTAAKALVDRIVNRLAGQANEHTSRQKTKRDKHGRRR